MGKTTHINRDNPAFNFISAATMTEPAEPKADATAPAQDKAPEGYKPNPQYVEKKTRRLQLVLQPSVYEKVKAKAEATGKSVNDYIHTILEDATRGE